MGDLGLRAGVAPVGQLDPACPLSRLLMHPEAFAGVVARAGSDAPLLRAGPMGDLLKLDFGPPLHRIVVPGELHFLEEEALKVLARLDRPVAPEG